MANDRIMTIVKNLDNLYPQKRRAKKMREFDVVMEIIENLDNLYGRMVDLYGVDKASKYFIERCKIMGKYLKEAENVKKKEKEKNTEKRRKKFIKKSRF